MISMYDRRSLRRWETEDKEFLDVLSRVAPGTGIRTAVERIIQQATVRLW